MHKIRYKRKLMAQFFFPFFETSGCYPARSTSCIHLKFCPVTKCFGEWRRQTEIGVVVKLVILRNGCRNHVWTSCRNLTNSQDNCTHFVANLWNASNVANSRREWQFDQEKENASSRIFWNLSLHVDFPSENPFFLFLLWWALMHTTQVPNQESNNL